PLVGVAQEGGGVVERHDAASVHVEPLAVLLRYAEVRLYELHRGDAAQADDHLRLQQLYLVLEPLGAGLLLRDGRVAVLGRAALDHVADEHLFPAEVYELQHIVEQLAAAAYKGPAAQVLLLAGAFAYEHDLRVLRPFSEHHMRSRLAQAAAAAGQ